nr:MAG TPA_asm: hypothetical protein [Caudoviricetes sp.]
MTALDWLLFALQRPHHPLARFRRNLMTYSTNFCGNCLGLRRIGESDGDVR